MIENGVDEFLNVLDFEASNLVGRVLQVDEAHVLDVTHKSALPVSSAMSKACAGVPMETLAE